MPAAERIPYAQSLIKNLQKSCSLTVDDLFSILDIRALVFLYKLFCLATASSPVNNSDLILQNDPSLEISSTMNPISIIWSFLPSTIVDTGALKKLDARYTNA